MLYGSKMEILPGLSMRGLSQIAYCLLRMALGAWTIELGA
jgi:hypothetical protein